VTPSNVKEIYPRFRGNLENLFHIKRSAYENAELFKVTVVTTSIFKRISLHLIVTYSTDYRPIESI
jgi:hypothetical protein